MLILLDFFCSPYRTFDYQATILGACPGSVECTQRERLVTNTEGYTGPTKSVRNVTRGVGFPWKCWNHGRTIYTYNSIEEKDILRSSYSFIIAKLCQESVKAEILTRIDVLKLIEDFLEGTAKEEDDGVEKMSNVWVALLKLDTTPSTPVPTPSWKKELKISGQMGDPKSQLSFADRDCCD